MKKLSNCPQCGGVMRNEPGTNLCPWCVGRICLGGLNQDLSGGMGNEEGGPRLFGGYEIEEEAGRGAMGVVFRARQAGLNRTVALKMVLSGFLAGSEERLRFRSEAELVARLDHPNIVPIYEFGEWEGRQFYVMRWLSGGAISIPFQGGVRAAVELMVKVCRAVHHAHQRGVLHRDIKPANILLDEQGEPYVADFGLARRLDEDGVLTLTGTQLGTPAYMAPEQAAGQQGITTAADVWSLGAVLCHLLTGSPPFQGATLADLLIQVREGMVSDLGERGAALDADLRTICLRCLRKDPSARYGSAEAVAEDMERWLAGVPIEARPLTAYERLRMVVTRNPKVVGLALGMACLVVVSLFAILGQWLRAERGSEEARVALMRLRAQTAQQAVENGDPMGTLPWLASALHSEPRSSKRSEMYRRFLSTVVEEGMIPQDMWFFDRAVSRVVWLGRGDEFLVELGGGRIAKVGSEGVEKTLVEASSALWVDGIHLNGDRTKFIRISREGRYEVRTATSGELVASEEIEVPEVRVVVRSRDRRFIAVGSKFGRVKVVELESGLGVGVEVDMGARVSSLDFSPDGTRLVGVSEDQKVMVWEIRSGRRLAVRGGERFSRALFDPSGGKIVVNVGRHGWAQMLRVDDLGDLGRRMEHGDAMYAMGWGLEGARIATGGEDGVVRIWDGKSGDAVGVVMKHEAGVMEVVYSFDGRRIATVDRGQWVRVWNAETGEPTTPWLRHGGRVNSVVFGEGDGVLLTGCQDGTLRSWVLREKRSFEAKLVPGGDPVWGMDISRDGTSVLVRGGDSGRVHSTVDWRLVGKVFRQGEVMDYGKFSWDGKYVATAGRNSPVVEVRSVGGGEVSGRWVHSNRVTAVAWVPESHTVLSAENLSGVVMWDGLSGRKIRTIGTEGFLAAGLECSPNGRWYAAGFPGWTGLWDLKTAERRWHRSLVQGLVNRLVFSHDSKLLIAGDDIGAVRVYEVGTGEQRLPTLLHGGPVEILQLSEEGEVLMVMVRGLEVRLWNVQSGEALGIPISIRGGVQKAALSRDGKWVAVGGKVGFQIWDVESGVAVTPLITTGEEIAGFQFRVGDEVVAFTELGVVHVSSYRPLDWTAEEWVGVARLLGGFELSKSGATMLSALAGVERSERERSEAEAQWRWLKGRLRARAGESQK